MKNSWKIIMKIIDFENLNDNKIITKIIYRKWNSIKRKTDRNKTNRRYWWRINSKIYINIMDANTTIKWFKT